MSQIWNFLIVNRDTLTWLGSGLVVVCGGLWTVIRFIVDRSRSTTETTPPTPQPTTSTCIDASRGGIAGGGDVSVSTQTGMPPRHTVLLVLAILGALLIIVTQVGNKVSVSDGVGVGGNFTGTLTNQQ